MNPDVRVHARAMVPRVGVHYNAVWKELLHLEEAGVLLSEPLANTKLYHLNPQYPILPELRAIVLKTTGLGNVLREALGGFPETKAAFIYGSFAAGDMDHQSDIDLMLIGKINLTRLAPVIAKVEKDLGRSVNYIAYTPDEWSEKVTAREPFIKNILSSPKIMLIGEEDALRATDSAKSHQGIQSAPRGNPPPAPGRRTRPRHRRA
ncbi:MAG: nucleotidyltransferase domain-containing protein [Acidobacteriota bacterium]